MGIMARRRQKQERKIIGAVELPKQQPQNSEVFVEEPKVESKVEVKSEVKSEEKKPLVKPKGR